MSAFVASAELTPSMCAPTWHAVVVHARKERAAQRALLDREIEAYVPMGRDRRMWSDRIQTVESAVFPGYLFVRLVLDVRTKVSVIGARHVVDFVGRLPGDNRIARAIPDHEMASLRAFIDGAQKTDPVSKLVHGTRVRVVLGPLKGATGVIETAPDGQRRLTAMITLLGRGVRTVLSADDVLAAEMPLAA